MAPHIAFAPGAQPQTFLVTPQFIGQRAERELADATIIPFTPKSYNKVDNIPAADCRKLEGQFGSGFAQIIAQDPEVLGNFKYSDEKKEVIVKACVNEAKAEAKEDPATSKIVAMLCACV